MYPMQVWLIRFEDENGRELRGPAGTGLRNSVRMAANDQTLVELKADEILNAWLKANPGRTGSWTITLWVQSRELREAELGQLAELLRPIH